MEEFYWRTGDEKEFIENALYEPHEMANGTAKVRTVEQKKQFLRQYLLNAEKRSKWKFEETLTRSVREGMVWVDREMKCITDIDAPHLLAFVRTELEKLR